MSILITDVITKLSSLVTDESAISVGENKNSPASSSKKNLPKL